MKAIQPLLSLWIILIVISMYGSNRSWANENVNEPAKLNHLGISVNSGLISYREDLVVPLGFHGLGLSLGVIYSRQTDKNSVDARWRFGFGYMQNRYDHEALIMVQEIRLSWLKKFTSSQRNGEFWVGACLPLQMNNLFWGSWDDAHLYWLTAYGMGTAFQWQKNISSDKQALVRIEIPFINWISRPPRVKWIPARSRFRQLLRRPGRTRRSLKRPSMGTAY